RRAPVVTDTESAPWPEREAPPAAAKRPEARANTSAPVLPAVRRDLPAQRPATVVATPADTRTAAPAAVASRAPAAKHTSVPAVAEPEPARKATAAIAAPPTATGAAARQAADGIQA